MIPIFRPDEGVALGPGTVAILHRRQQNAATLTPREKKIGARWDYFLNHDTAAAQDLRARLDELFHGKCCYCEKIIARDIEHYCPKSLYPTLMFEWTNVLPPHPPAPPRGAGSLLRACKDCNFEKLDRDPLDASGNRILLDPTRDDPADFFMWDMETGMPLYTDPSTSFRGRATVEACDLDNQKYNEQRRARANEFLYILLQTTEEPLTEATRSRLEEVTRPGQPWQSVVRQIVRDPQYSVFVNEAEHRLPLLIPRFEALRRTHRTA